MNIFNPALVTRAFLFFAWPTKMSGDAVWVSTEQVLGLGQNLPDGFTAATALGQAGANHPITTSVCEMFTGLMPGSIGETSFIAIMLGAALLLWTRIASWRTMFSVFAGGALVALLFKSFGAADNVSAQLGVEHLLLGGFAFGAVFMATDPVTSARTEKGQFIYGFLIGAIGDHDSRAQSRLSRRHDARHPVYEHVCTAHRLCVRAAQHQQALASRQTTIKRSRQ